MRTVCEINKLAGGRYQVILDDSSSFPLYAKELAIYGIEEGFELTDALYHTILQDVLIRRARLKTMHLLETQDRTEYQLRTKLAQLSYPEELIDDALEYVKKFHYVDDLRYAVNYMETRKEQKSMRQMEQDLLQKGIAKEILREAKEQIETPDEEQQIRMWIEKKHFDQETADQKETEKMFRFLLRKGYGYSLIADVIHQ